MHFHDHFISTSASLRSLSSARPHSQDLEWSPSRAGCSFTSRVIIKAPKGRVSAFAAQQFVVAAKPRFLAMSLWVACLLKSFLAARDIMGNGVPIVDCVIREIRIARTNVPSEMLLTRE